MATAGRPCVQGNRSWGARDSACFFRDGRETGAHVDCVYSRGKDGGVLPVCGGAERPENGRRSICAVRNAICWAAADGVVARLRRMMPPVPCCFAVIGIRQRQYRGVRAWSARDLKSQRQVAIDCREWRFIDSRESSLNAGLRDPILYGCFENVDVYVG